MRRLIDRAELEGDLVGHERQAWEGRHGVPQRVVRFVRDDESFDSLSWHSQMAADIPHVTCYLADDHIRRPSSLQFHHDQRISHLVNTQEVKATDGRDEL